jgi:hypothetical protein
VLDQTNNADINGLAQATFGLIGAGNQSGEVQGLFSSFRADDPQMIVDLDRDKARSLGLPIREVTDALQVFLGSAYVNDFDFNNRAYRVYAQADQQFRSTPSDLKQLYARAGNGDMVPLDTVVRLRETTAPQVISHFNLFRSAEITAIRLPARVRVKRCSPCRIWRGKTSPRDSISPGRAVARRDQCGSQAASSSASHSSSSTWCSPHSTRAGCCRSSFCLVCRWRYSAPCRHSSSGGWPTTCSVRSDWCC